MKSVALVSVLLRNVEGKGKVHLELAMKVLREGARWSIALIFFNLSSRWGMWSTPRPGHFNPEKIPCTNVWGAGRSPKTVWMDAENFAYNCIQSPDRQTRNESLYLLRYPAQTYVIFLKKKMHTASRWTRNPLIATLLLAYDDSARSAEGLLGHAQSRVNATPRD